MNNNACFWIYNCFVFPCQNLNWHPDVQIQSSSALPFFFLHALSNSFFFNFTENFLHLVRLILSQEMDLCWVTYVRASKLLQIRELYGNVILFKNRKRNFKEEFRKIQVSQPAVCSLMMGWNFWMYCFSSFYSACWIF